MKITLMDIMESLNGDNVEDAQAALHEWFVEQSKQVHANLTAEPVVESEETDECEEEKVDEAIVDEAPRNVDKSHQTVYAELQKIVPTLQNLTPQDKQIVDEIVKLVKGRSVGAAIGRFKKLADPAVKAALKPALALWRAAPAAAPAPAPKADYSNLELIDDDYFEVDDMVGQEIDAGKTGGVEKDVHWMRTGVTGDVVWALNADEIDAIAAQAGFGQADFSGTFPHANHAGGDDIEFFYNAYNVTGEPQHQTESVVESEEVEEEETVEESVEDLIAELAESFKGLETVSDKLQNVEGAQVGEEGKVPVNKKSTLPNNKADKRLGGDPVEVKSNGHTGHALEKAPAVKDAPVKHHVQNSKDDPKKVSAEKSALLNKMDGSVNTQSPISGKGAKGLKK